MSAVLTVSDLSSLTFGSLPQVTSRYDETEGVAANRGIRYRKAIVTAIDEEGREREFIVVVDSTGKTTVKAGSVTRDQVHKESEEEFHSLPDYARRFVEMHWGNNGLNAVQKLIIGKIAAGMPYSKPSARAVLGGSARWVLMELFPGIQTLEDAEKAIRKAALSFAGRFPVA